MADDLPARAFLPRHPRDPAHASLALIRVREHARSRKHGALPHARQLPRRTLRRAAPSGRHAE